MISCDICIVGAGAVGSAIARELILKHPSCKIVVMEKRAGPGQEMSGHSSGVLHSGFHHPPDSLKARFARIGSELARNYAKEKGVPLLECGMLIGISAKAIREGLWREVGALSDLLSRGREQNISYRFLSPWGVRKKVPVIKSLGGIFIPEVAVIDAEKFVEALSSDAASRGVQFLYGNEAVAISVGPDDYALASAKNFVSSRILINAAGLFADEIAKMAGINRYKIYPWRGDYYEIIDGPGKDIRCLVYPATPPGSPSKGIHFGPRPDGRVFLGPDARPAKSKSDYAPDESALEKILEAGRAFLPDLKPSNLKWHSAGIRAKLSPDGREDDFTMRLDRQEPPLFNLIGIDSPGLSAAMGIAKDVTENIVEFI